MSREEKIALARSDFDAPSHLRVAELIYTDGPCGVRDADGITALPVGTVRLVS
jgi:hypothetical protein